MIPTFPAAKYYSCTDPETLTHESPEEAVEEYVDDILSPGCDTAAVIREWMKGRPLRVTGYDPDAVSPAWLKREAERVMEQLTEDWQDEYGDPDGDRDPDFPAGADDLMASLVRVLFAHATPWACKDVGHVDLTPEQVEEMMRTYRPEWFEAASGSASGGSGTEGGR